MMVRTAFIDYVSNSKPIMLRRTQRSPKPVKVGVRTLHRGLDVTVDLTVYDDGSYEVASGGLIKYVGAVS